MKIIINTGWSKIISTGISAHKANINLRITSISLACNTNGRNNTIRISSIIKIILRFNTVICWTTITTIIPFYSLDISIVELNNQTINGKYDSSGISNSGQLIINTRISDRRLSPCLDNNVSKFIRSYRLTSDKVEYVLHFQGCVTIHVEIKGQFFPMRN